MNLVSSAEVVTISPDPRDFDPAPMKGYEDLHTLRIFGKMTEAQLNSLFGSADKLGVRQVKDMPAMMKYFKTFFNDDTMAAWHAGVYKKNYFQLKSARAWEAHHPVHVVDSFEVESTKTEADDRNWPTATFLKLGKTWVLLPEKVCGTFCGTPFVAKDVDSNYVVFAQESHRGSGGLGGVRVRSLSFDITSVDGPKITGYSNWAEERPLE